MLASTHRHSGASRSDEPGIHNHDVSMDSGQPLRGFRNDDLSDIDRSQEVLGFFARRKTTNLAIVGIVLGRIGRTYRNELVAVLLDKLGQVFTVKRRHMPRAAMRTIIVACAGP